MDERKIDFRYNLGEYWRFVSKYRLALFGLLALAFALQAIPAAESYLLKVFVDEATAFSSGQLGLEGFYGVIIAIVAGFLVFVACSTVFKWLSEHLLISLEADLIFDLKNRFFGHILGLDYKFHASHKTGSLISKLTRGASAIEHLTDSLVYNFLPVLFSILIAIVSILYFDAFLAAIVTVVGILFAAYTFFMHQKQVPLGLASNNAEDFEKGQISDFFTNFESIKYFGKEKRAKKIFMSTSGNTAKLLKIYWFRYRWLTGGQIFIGGIGTVLIVYFSLNSLAAGAISVGTIVFIYTMYAGLLERLFMLTWGIRNFYSSVSDLDPLFQYGKIENEVKDNQNAKSLRISHGKIEFREVSFSYKKRKIFSGLSLVVPANRKVAIVGPSGAGKSTLVKLLYRFYDIDSGKILIDGNDISMVKQESLRSELSIVPQDCVLFDDSIYNNIAFSRPNAPRKDVWKAMRFAQLDKIVKTFPNKEDTIVGERGIKLSGGEKQRVSIARAILANKKVLVLDEATSSLDSETEHEIQGDLHELMKGRTSIIIAHRLSTIMHADFIVVLEKGKIAQIGSHAELIGKKGLYSKLWELQKGGYIK